MHEPIVGGEAGSASSGVVKRYYNRLGIMFAPRAKSQLLARIGNRAALQQGTTHRVYKVAYCTARPLLLDRNVL